jgi:asparagine synthase (glutamine-hydrolysing)
MAAAGLEVRVPFLQKDLVEFVRYLDPELLMYSTEEYFATGDAFAKQTSLDRSIEKALLRGMAAKFDLLPAEVIWRPKEAFSDAVGFSWKDAIEQHTADIKLDEYKHLTPISKEAQWYREIFDSHFPNQEKILPHYWLPKKFETNDPSARVLPTYHGTDFKKSIN